MQQLTQSPTNLILVVEDVHETRDGIEKLLKSDGYLVSVARDEQDAIASVILNRPDLILVSLAGSPGDVILSARRIREADQSAETLPVVVFCIPGINEGDEVALGQNVHITRPDNFNQLRNLIERLVRKSTELLPLEMILKAQAMPVSVNDRSREERKAQDEKDGSAE